MKPSSFISAPSAQGGYQQGLIGLRERVILLGERVAIESTPGNGTRLNVDVSLP